MDEQERFCFKLCTLCSTDQQISKVIRVECEILDYFLPFIHYRAICNR